MISDTKNNLHRADEELPHDHPADQTTQPAAVHDQPDHPAQDQLEVDVPKVPHLPDPRDLDKEQPRRSRRVCKKRYDCLDVDNL